MIHLIVSRSLLWMSVANLVITKLIVSVISLECCESSLLQSLQVLLQAIVFYFVLWRQWQWVIKFYLYYLQIVWISLLKKAEELLKINTNEVMSWWAKLMKRWLGSRVRMYAIRRNDLWIKENPNFVSGSERYYFCLVFVFCFFDSLKGRKKKNCETVSIQSKFRRRFYNFFTDFERLLNEGVEVTFFFPSYAKNWDDLD